MGQANKRGSREDRAAEAEAKIKAMTPKVIICNHCQAEITDIHAMDTRSMPGIDAAFAGMCTCGQSTWALAGDQAAVARVSRALQDEIGSEPLIGSMPFNRS
jgi:hypothetical protein